MFFLSKEQNPILRLIWRIDGNKCVSKGISSLFQAKMLDVSLKLKFGKNKGFAFMYELHIWDLDVDQRLCKHEASHQEVKTRH